jgi:aminomethyltransferase
VSFDEILRAAGATLGERDGSDVPLAFSTLEAEVRALRESAGLSALPHLTCLRVAGDGAADALDPICPAELLLRSGTIRHTLLLREDGRPFVDLYLCNDDDSYLLIAEGTGPGELEAYLKAHFPVGHRAVVEDLGAEHVMLSLSGPFAWEVMVELEGPEIIGFPYLSFYRPTERRTYFRAGKTGEFGYDLLVPRAQVDRYWERLLEAGAPFDVIPVGLLALDHAALENWFFNIHREGRADLTPLELGLSWRLSWDKSFVGKEALIRRKQAGVTHKIAALESTEPFEDGDAVRIEDRAIGTVLAAARSITLGEHIGIGLLEQAYAHSGIDQYRVEHRGSERPVRTVSAPFVNNRSLFVNPERHSYNDRAAIHFPPPLRNPPKPKPGARR